MATNLDQTGVMQVNGAWATRVQYEAAVLGLNTGTVDLRFMQGRTQIARVSLPHDQLSELLGDRNTRTIEKHVASDADKYLATVKGELRGTRLHYREVTLVPTESRVPENSIELSWTRSNREEESVKDSPVERMDSDKGRPATPQPNKWSERAAFEQIQRRFEDAETASLNALDRRRIRAVVNEDLQALAQLRNTDLRRDALSTMDSLAVEFSSYKTELVRQAPDIDKEAEQVNREIDNPPLEARAEPESSGPSKSPSSDATRAKPGGTEQQSGTATEQERAAHGMIETSYYDSLIVPDIYSDAIVARAAVEEDLASLQHIHDPALRSDALATMDYLSEEFPPYKSELFRQAPEIGNDADRIDLESRQRPSDSSKPSSRSQEAQSRAADTADEKAADPLNIPNEQEGRQDSTNAKDEATTRAAKSNAPDSKAVDDPVPPHIASKYLVKNDTYYFDDRTIAFVDRGSRLRVETHNKAVIQDLVEIAKSRDWQEVNVTGTQSFRREAWKEAYAAGLTVKGYKPSEIELEAAQRERLRRNGPNELAADHREREVPGATSGTQPSRAPRHSAPAKGVVYGTLVAHDEAPYQHDATKSTSYYVTLKQDSGKERTFWGVGLADAIKHAKSGPTIGDQVGIRRVGSRPVSVTSRAVDTNGEILARQIDTKRNQWLLEKAAYFKTNPDLQAGSSSTRSETATVATAPEVESKSNSPNRMTREQEVAAAIRSAETTREELQLKYPELNKAVFQHLESHAQFAQAYVKAGLIRETDRAQVIGQMRERLASQIERGTPIKEPDNKQVNTLIRRSVDRVAADIGRQPVEIQPRTAEQAATPKTLVRDDVQVRP